MPSRMQQDRILGVVMLAFGLAVALLWVPIDVETGLAERVRGRSSIGDALAPTMAAGLLAFAGLWLAVAGGRGARLSALNLVWLVTLSACLALSLLLMRWIGPAAVALVLDAEYRPLRDTAPWKHLGFVFGGGVMVFALISLVEHRRRWRTAAIAFGVALGVALLYDLPFDDLLLPPNGDV